MRELILTFLCAFVMFQAGQSCAVNASEPKLPKYRIAIIDTGYKVNAPGSKLKLCKTGHYDFRTHTPTIRSTYEHGTRVANIIASMLADIDYCAVIFQTMQSRSNYTYDINDVVSALTMAKDQNLNVVNYSAAGALTSVAEREALRALVDGGASVFVAAGNKKLNLDEECLAFPACFDIPGMNVVGALDPETGKTAKYSNYGERIKLWYSGKSPDGSEDGTSFAAPRALASYILRMEKESKPTNIKTPLAQQSKRSTNTQN